MLLSDQVILVTGAGRGIGRGICTALAEEGAAVVAIDLDGEAGRETAAIVTGSGGRALALTADVTDSVRFRAVIEEVVASLGRCDGLVNNAGVIRMNPALEATAGEFARELEVNTQAVLSCCRAVARHWVAAGGGGAIVNVASNAGKVGYPNMAGYNASKAAVISLTRSLAAEWAEHGINVNAVCPGGVDTPMLSQVAKWLAPRLGEEPEELRAGMVPAQLGRHVRPEEVGGVVAFLLSEKAAAIRGQAINVDGGEAPY